MSQWKKICCAVDFSDQSRFAMEEAAALASRSDGDLALIHVVAGQPPCEARLPYRSELSPVHAGDPARHLEDWRNAAERISKNRVSASLLTGAAVDEILRFAREGRYDVLVIGTPGVLGCERIVLGSVAESVIRGAPCSVVVARQPVELERLSKDHPGDERSRVLSHRATLVGSARRSHGSVRRHGAHGSV
jgi:nucleotide-binding universal stress UspA family protein